MFLSDVLVLETRPYWERDRDVPEIVARSVVVRREGNSVVCVPVSELGDASNDEDIFAVSSGGDLFEKDICQGRSSGACS